MRSKPTNTARGTPWDWRTCGALAKREKRRGAYPSKRREARRRALRLDAVRCRGPWVRAFLFAPTCVNLSAPRTLGVPRALGAFSGSGRLVAPKPVGRRRTVWNAAYPGPTKSTGAAERWLPHSSFRGASEASEPEIQGDTVGPIIAALDSGLRPEFTIGPAFGRTRWAGPGMTLRINRRRAQRARATNRSVAGGLRFRGAHPTNGGKRRAHLHGVSFFISSDVILPLMEKSV